TGIKKEAILGKGGYEYSVPFYGEKRPILVDLVLSRDEETGKRYPGLERKGDKIASELFAPNLYGGKGAYLWFSASPLCDTHGTVIGAIEAIRDITDHKSAEARLRASNAELSAAYEQLTAAQEELRQNYDELARSQQELQTSEERYRNVVEDQTEFICRFTPEGKLTFVNDAYCRYFGLDKRSCIGKPHSVVIPPEDLPLLKDHLKALSPENPVAIIEHRIVMPSGTVRWQRWSDRAIFDPGGRITEFQSVGRDTTDRVQVELSLQEAYRKLGILSSVTRHDILNTIDGLRTYLELSKQGLSDPKLLDFIHKEEQAAEAIQWQIEFTRNYQNIGAQAPGWQVLEEVIGSAIRQLDMPGVEIHTHVAGVEIFADPLVEKVFYNLMENSLRHGRHVTRMDYSVRETDRALLLTYRDNGVGISDGIRKKLFRKGFGSHTGLGLFLSREILSITGMTIRENGEHGRGARFEITIPKGVYRGKDGKPYREPASP
ncbi:MAG TPA: PAS domain S-box protein, partial [Methanoregula sp.]|nr:PAS domain S-box protein [Methanoregula sp.]